MMSRILGGREWVWIGRYHSRVLRERGLMAIERLMGMLLVMVAVQMLMNGVQEFLKR